MNIGIEIKTNQMILAAEEAGHFTILGEHTFPSSVPLVQQLEWISQFFPFSPEDSLCLSVPSWWTLTQRKVCVDALATLGLTQYVLIPDCIAALATFKNRYPQVEKLDFIYISESPLAKKVSSSMAFSFLSYFEAPFSLLWEGSWVRDGKFLRKMANSLGFLHKSKWSPHIALLGSKDLISKAFTSSLGQELPSYVLDEEAVLRGMTSYKETMLELSSHLYGRCHSRFYLQKEGETTPYFLPTSGALIPWLWNNYHCLYFFRGTEVFAVGEKVPSTWNFYEKPVWENQESHELLASPVPLFSFVLSEPCGLWLNSSDGTVELLPFVENTPQITHDSLFGPRSEAEAQGELEKFLQRLSSNETFHEKSSSLS